MLFKPVKKLTKRQIKEDKFVTRTAQAWDWIQDNYPKLIGGAAGAVVLLLLANYLLGRSERQTAEAAEAFSKAQIAAMEGRTGEAMLQGEEVSKKYSGTGPGAQALLLVANATFEMGRVADAKAAFQRCIDEYGKDPVMVYAGWNGVAACLEQEGKLREAAGKYEGFAQKYDKSPFAGSAMKEAARCYGATGDLEKARTLLQAITEKYKNTPLASEAQARLKMM
jgi:TolA-binding protein